MNTKSKTDHDKRFRASGSGRLRLSATRKKPRGEHLHLFRERKKLNQGKENKTPDVEKEYKIIGRRLVDITFFFEQIKDLSSHGVTDCSLKDMDIIAEELHGARSAIKVKCKACDITRSIWTDRPVMEESRSSFAAPFNPMQSSLFGLSQLGAIPGLSNIGLGSPNFVMVQKEMENALQKDPDLYLQIIENPFVQSVMENPTFLQQAVTSNSQMAEMLKVNPGLNQVMNDPEALRVSLEQARNPELIQELIQFRIDAAADEKSCIKAGTVIKDLNKEDEGTKQTPYVPSKKSETAASVNPVDLLSSPPLQNIMKGMVDNPNLVKEMFSAPYMGAMLKGLTNNPEAATEIMLNNPIFADFTREQVKKMLPAFLIQMQNPEVHNFVSNPEAIAAMMNIHQSMEQLQQVAPNVFNMFPDQPPIITLLSPDQTTAPPGGPEDNSTSDTFSIFMSNMVNAVSQGTNTDGPPEERYKGQLDKMKTM